MGRLIQNLEAWVPVAVVLLLAMVTTWLWRVVEGGGAWGQKSVRHIPDLLMSHFSALQLGENGQIRYTLDASKMVHYPDDDTSHFETVLFTSYESNGPPVDVRSERAVRSEPHDEVVFTGHVVVTRQPTPEEPRTVMTTSILTAYPQRGIEKTDQPVVVTYGQDRLLANSMIVDNKTKVAHFTHAKLLYHSAPRHP